MRGPLTETVENTQKFSDALARNADGVDKFLESVSTLSEELAGVSGKLDGTLRAAEELLKSVDRRKGRDRSSPMSKHSPRTSAKPAPQFDEIVKRVDTAVGSINEFAEKGSDTLAKVDGVLEAVDPARVRSALSNIE